MLQLLVSLPALLSAVDGTRAEHRTVIERASSHAASCLDTLIHNNTDSSGDCTGDSPLHHTGPGANPEWCRTLCCARNECIGFTFTDPQPGSNGTAVDCWLKTKDMQLRPGVCGSSPPGTIPGRCWSAILPPKPPPPLEFIPVFSVSGYDSRSSKWLFVRPSAPVEPQETTDWHVNATVEIDGRQPTTETLPFAGTTFGVQLWGPLNFQDATGPVRVSVMYHRRSNHTVGGSAMPIVVPVVSGRRQAFKPLVRGLALVNAIHRNCSRYDDSGICGGGFVDCNSCMGEANSHGSFLAGLAAVFAADSNASGAMYLSQSNRSNLTAQMAMGVRYLLRLSQAATGEIRHEFCQDFSHPSDGTCRQNYAGYGGPHHSSIALVGLLQFVHSLDSTRFERIQPELRSLIPAVLRVVNHTRGFLRDGAPLSSVVNGTAGNRPSCSTGDCFVLPYWPELVPSYEWVVYRSCQAWSGSSSEIQSICHTTGSLRQMRARAVLATRALYGTYNLSQRVRNLTTDEGTFRGVPWFQALQLAHLTALEEQDNGLEKEVGALATSIAQQYADLSNGFHVLPLMIDASETRDLPNFPGNPQGAGLGNAALGMQALDASQLGVIIAHSIAHHNAEAEDVSVVGQLAQSMERWSNAALSWVQGLSPGVPCSATSWALNSSTQSMGSICAASMVVHARSVDGLPVPFLLPWAERWWSGGATCGRTVTAPSPMDTFDKVPAVMSIINGLATSNTWEVGFPETYILHDGAYLRGVVAYEQLLDAMEDAGLTALETPRL